MKFCVATLFGIYVATTIAVNVIKNLQGNIELELPHGVKPKVNYLTGKETSDDLPDLVYDDNTDEEIEEPATPKP